MSPGANTTNTSYSLTAVSHMFMHMPYAIVQSNMHAMYPRALVSTPGKYGHQYPGDAIYNSTHPNELGLLHWHGNVELDICLACHILICCAAKMMQPVK